MVKKISVIVPCYNEEESIPLFYEEINKVIDQMKVKFELIFVNDGSKDNTLNILRKLSKEDKNIRYISFSRNFGKEAGILAGLEAATGDYICMMDVDLQDPPKLLIEMYETLETTDYDCVATRSVSRNGYSFFRKLFTKWYYKIINKISKTEIIDGARDFRLMTRQMVDAILLLKENNRYSKGIFSWVGFKTKWLTFENKERIAGTTKWNFFKLFSYSLESILGFSTVPLMLSYLFGFLFCLVSLILFIIFLFNKVNVLVIISMLFLIGGVQLICLGILSHYLSKTYLEVKNRPVYIIKETEND